jgi:HEAT repeat protein
VPKAAEPPAPPLRTWRPMVLWTGGILLALGLVWSAASVGVDVWETCKVMERVGQGADYMTVPPELGTRERAARRLSRYLRLPKHLAPYQTRAACLLENCGEPAVPGILELLDHRDAEVRRVAVLALYRRRDGSLAPAVIPALKDGDKEVRSWAARLLGEVRCEGAVEPLIASLGEGDEGALYSILLALGRIGDRRAAGPLIGVLGHRNWVARKTAAWALGEIGDSRASQPLQRLLTDEDADVRNSAERSLEKIKAAQQKDKQEG